MLIYVIFFAGCINPKPLLRLNIKENPSLSYWQGKEMNTMRKDSLEVVVFFDQKSYSRKHFAINVSVRNLSSKNILVNPTTFFYVTETIEYKKIIWKTTQPQSSVKVNALEPEPLIFATQQIKRKDILKMQLTKKIIRKTKPRSHRKQQKLDNKIMQSTLGRIQFSQNDNQKRVSTTNNNIFLMENMRNEPLRKTTLKQNEEISGKVWFSILPEYKGLSIFVEVNGIKFEIPYTQITFTGTPNTKRKHILD